MVNQHGARPFRGRVILPQSIGWYLVVHEHPYTWGQGNRKPNDALMQADIPDPTVDTCLGARMHDFIRSMAAYVEAHQGVAYDAPRCARHMGLFFWDWHME